MSTQGSEHGSGEQKADESGPEGKQHGDPLLSTVHGRPEEGSRQGEVPPAVPEADTHG